MINNQDLISCGSSEPEKEKIMNTITIANYHIGIILFGILLVFSFFSIKITKTRNTLMILLSVICAITIIRICNSGIPVFDSSQKMEKAFTQQTGYVTSNDLDIHNGTIKTVSIHKQDTLDKAYLSYKITSDFESVTMTYKIQDNVSDKDKGTSQITEDEEDSPNTEETSPVDKE